ncbi:MAG: PIN domain-containing protein [Chloroflexi bacterium]|nr:PIN domain-containing protein [Chloroflexota bacterium]MBU1660192.1 PIN domain-containing protein [Chloroflexota bacterium]
MTDHLLDSGILIRHLRDQRDYVALVDRLSDEGDLFIASFTRLEIVRGMRKRERQDTFELMDSMFTLPMDHIIADQAGELIQSWRTRGITLGDADAVIAASAIAYELDLITTNARHFPMPELTVWQADEVGNLSIYEH